MITEILAVLIIFGAVLLLAIRYIINRNQQKENYEIEQEYLAESTNKFKTDLNETADAILKKMNSQAAQLDKIMQEADNRRVTLEARIVEGERLAWELKNRLEELERRLNDLKAIKVDTEQLERKINELNERYNAGQQTRQPIAPVSVNNTSAIRANEVIPVAKPAPARLANTNQPPANRSTVNTTARRVDSEDFATVLHKSIIRENSAPVATSANTPVRRPVPTVSANSKATPALSINAESPREKKVSQPIDINQANLGGDRVLPPKANNKDNNQEMLPWQRDDIRFKPARENNDNQNTDDKQTLNNSQALNTEEDRTNQQTTKALSLLKQGNSVEQVSKDTGLSMAAINLMKQMNKI